MSAIWGKIVFGDIDKADAKQDCNLMKEVYQNKCKLDKIQQISNNNVYMGCGLQYITDIAKYEQLPIYDKDAGCYFMADCILDNRHQLIKELSLESENNKKIPDGTLMYYAYKKWGIDSLTHFRGLFSMAVYDEKKQVLYLASDPVSSRCLYYYKKNNEYVFSTLIKPILKIYPEIKHNQLYLKDFLTAPGLLPNIMPVETPYENIYKLNPGTYLECTINSIKEYEYFDISKPMDDCKCRTAKEYGKYFRELYQKCVTDAVNTNGEVGIAMSSGLDSASVGALAADFLRQSDKSLFSYTYVTYESGVKDNDRHHVLDEQNDVMEIVQMHDNIIPHFLSNSGKNCCDDMHKCMEIMEIPFKAVVNLPNLCEIYENASSQGCKVVLSGQFGNSTVSHGYIDDVLYDLYKNKKYLTFLFYLNHYSKTVKESRKSALRGCKEYFKYTDKIYNDTIFNYEPDNPFINQNLLNEYPIKKRYTDNGVTIFENVPTSQDLYRRMLCQRAVYTYLGELDTKFGLAHNLILRDPTRDERMLRFCYNIPYRFFSYRGIPRWLIRGNLDDLLPKYMINKWMRYCVQNSDWFLRIKRDWKDLYYKFYNTISDSAVTEYTDSKKAIDFIEKFDKLEENEAGNKLKYLLFIMVLKDFLQNKG